MSAPGIAPITVSLEGFSGRGKVATPALLSAMLGAAEKISDLIFSPGRPPQVQVYGQLIPVQVSGLDSLTADDTRHLAVDLIGDNKQAITTLREHGSCDISYGLPGVARFRVNIFIQRGSCAIVIRVIPTSIPDLASLRLPQQLTDVAKLRDGVVLVTGPAGSGKSSTLAVLLDCINREKCYHIITIEDPIEFLHNHKSSTIHQRELHSDTPSFAHALRSALRQAPKVIMLGELRDRETIEIVLEAAETGHLVLSSLNTMDASKTVERIVTAFTPLEQQAVRERFAKSFRYIISQRLLPKPDRSGRVPAAEILKSNARTRECIEKGEGEGKTLLDAIKAGASEGMQHFDGEIAQLVRNRVVDLETGISFASNPTVLGQELARTTSLYS
jgi:twitching motility protein PilT